MSGRGTTRKASAPTTDGPNPTHAGPDAPEVGTARRRPPPARLAPGEVARDRGDVREGLAWLGRTPESKASLLYRVARLAVRFLLFVVFRFRIRAIGRELLPARGGYLVIAAAHRGWMDPFVVMHALPGEPRAWFLGSAPSTFTSRSREALVHRLGGLLPVWRGGVGAETHVASARAVVANGGVFVQMPEGTVSGPPGRIGPFRIGAALIALRTGATVVPLAVAGTEELYLGKRMASQVLPPTSALELLGADAPSVLPAPGSREELDLARVVTARLEAVLGPAVEAIHPSTVDPPGARRPFRNRLTWLLLRPGRLDREERA